MEEINKSLSKIIVKKNPFNFTNPLFFVPSHLCLTFDFNVIYCVALNSAASVGEANYSGRAAAKELGGEEGV